MATPDTLARRGFALAFVGVLALPASVAVVTLVPEGSRRALFFTGLLVSAALSVIGGLNSRAAVMGRTRVARRAWAGAIVGLSLGATIAVFFAWSLLGALV